jgi:hypothetical protein
VCGCLNDLYQQTQPFKHYKLHACTLEDLSLRSDRPSLLICVREYGLYTLKAAVRTLPVAMHMSLTSTGCPAGDQCQRWAAHMQAGAQLAGVWINARCGVSRREPRLIVRARASCLTLSAWKMPAATVQSLSRSPTAALFGCYLKVAVVARWAANPLGYVWRLHSCAPHPQHPQVRASKSIHHCAPLNIPDFKFPIVHCFHVTL